MGILWKLVCAVALGILGPALPFNGARGEHHFSSVVRWELVQLEQEIGSHFAGELRCIGNPSAQNGWLHRDFQRKEWPSTPSFSVRRESSNLRLTKTPIEVSREGDAIQNPPAYLSDFNLRLPNRIASELDNQDPRFVPFPIGLESAFQPSAFSRDEGIGATLRLIRSALSLTERRVDQPNANYTQDHASDRRKPHDVGPKRGSLLRYQVIILTTLFTGLIVLFSFGIREALRLLATRQEGTGLACLCASVAGIFLSVIVGGLFVADLLRVAIYSAAGG